jgi:hypothetical protein
MLEDGHPRFESMKVGSVEPAGRQWWTVVGIIVVFALNETRYE